MKKGIVLSVVLLLVSGALFGQMTVGVKGGVPVSFATGTDWQDGLDQWTNDNRPIVGYSAGVFVSYGFAYGLALQPEAYYSKWGYGITDTDQSFVDYNERIVDVIELPVLLKYSLPAGPGLFSLFAGPQISLLLGDFTTKMVALDGSETEGTLVADNTLLYGVALGIGYDLPLGPGFIIFDTRYIMTFTEFLNTENTKLNNIGIRLGYGIRL